MAEVATLSVLLQARDKLSGPLGTMQGKLDQVAARAKKLGMAMTAMGGIITGAAALSIKNFVSMGDEIQKMALRTGFGTEALSEMAFALKISGSEIGAFEKGIKRMASFVLDAKDGLSTSTDALDRLGVSVKQLEGLSPEKAFELLSNAIAEVPDELTKAALAQDVFGRAGTGLLPLLNEGAEGIAALRREAHDLGVVFDQEMANKAAELGDTMTRLKGSMTGLSITIGSALAPILEEAVKRMTAVVLKVREWTKEHPQLTKFLVIAATAVGGLLLVLGPLLIMLPGIAAGIGLVSAASLPLTIIPLAIAAAVAALVAIFVKWEDMSTKIKVALFLIVPPLAALVFGIKTLQKHWDTIWPAMVQVTETAINGIIKGINFAMGAIADFVEATKELLDALPFGNPFGDAMDAAVKSLRTVIDEVDLTTKAVKTFGESLDLLEDMEDTFTIHIPKIEESLTGLADTTQTTVKAMSDEFVGLETRIGQFTLSALTHNETWRSDQRDTQEVLSQTLQAGIAERAAFAQAAGVAAEAQRITDLAALIKSEEEAETVLLNFLRAREIEIILAQEKLDVLAERAREIALVDEQTFRDKQVADFKAHQVLMRNLFLGPVMTETADISGSAQAALAQEAERFRFLRGLAEEIANGILAGGEGAVYRAHGGPLRAGQAAIVGERGPELFIPQSAGTVIPGASSGGGGGIVVNMTVNGDVTVDDLEDKVARMWLRRFNAGGFPQVARS